MPVPAFTSQSVSDVPASAIVAVTPNDATDLPDGICRGIYVGAAGAMKITDKEGNAVTLPGLLAGVVYPFRVDRVWSTGTTASSIFALY